MRKLFTTFLSGSILYTAITFFSARLPFIANFRLFSILAAIALLLILWFLNRRSEKAPSHSHIFAAANHVLCFFAGAALAVLIIIGLGRWRLAQAHAAVVNAGYQTAFPADNVIDKTEKNGMIFLDRLVHDKTFEKTLFSKRNGSTLVDDIQAALRLAQGDAKADPKALTRLRARRSQLLPMLKAMDHAQSAPHFSWNISYSVSPSISREFPKTSRLQTCVRAVAAEAVLLTEDGKYAQAESKLNQILWISKQFNRSPGVIGTLISIAMEKYAMDGSVLLLKKGEGTSFAKALLELDPEKAFKKSFGFEFAEFYHDLQKDTETPSVDYFIYPWIGWDVAAKLNDEIKQMNCFSDSPIETARCLQENISYARNYGWLLQSVSTPNRHEMYLRVALCSARQKMTMLAYLSGRYKKAHGHWPTRLDDLGFEATALHDPFTGKPFIMRQNAGKLEFICVGADGQEDGNQIKNDLDKDIVIRL